MIKPVARHLAAAGNHPPPSRGIRRKFRLCFLLALWFTTTLLPDLGMAAAVKKTAAELWALQPVGQPAVPAGVTTSTNPIDAFITAQYRARNLRPAPPADKATLLRRVYFDLIGLPPTPAQTETFLKDESGNAYEKVVDELLANEQHAVRYARHWLDVLRYADVDEKMVAAPGIYLWRDWVIRALSEDVPYDQFVRAQLTGYRSTARTEISATGYRFRTEPRPDDQFALGFLARGSVGCEGKDEQELAIAAVDTVSTAFMGMTVSCAKCHDHMYDPIKQRDYYSMKALFDPLVSRKILLGTPEELFQSGRAQAELEKRRAILEDPINELIAPYKKQLYADRLAMLPTDVRAIIQKPEKERTPAEQKIADDYYPIIRIDSDKLEEVMPPAERDKYKALQKELAALTPTGGRKSGVVPAFWTVEVDKGRELETSYILTSGDPDRPERNHPVEPGWPFASGKPDFREGRVEAFSDWLTAPENPLFARVAVNRLWQWHFGEGLQKIASDFGALGGTPANQPLLDWLAAEFLRHGFSMKYLHRLMVTSDTYKLASEVSPELLAVNAPADASDSQLWHFRLQRLEAEPIWDSLLTLAGNLDLTVGGPSMDLGDSPNRRPNAAKSKSGTTGTGKSRNRRAVYIARGYSSSREVMPNFLNAFDVDDGRAPCPLRTQTVTPPQSLFLMNSPEVDAAATRFAERLNTESHGDLPVAVKLGYQMALARPPSPAEMATAESFLSQDPARLKSFAWLLLNLDEFIYVR